MSLRRNIVRGLLASCVVAATAAPAVAQQQQKPNIVIIWGDDIGQSDISAYSHGLMGFKTPNIDRIAKEGVMFTDYYGEQSCTAGRASFITGQSGLRTGMTKVGLPGATLGLQKEDPTIAEMLKPLGYATGQFGKNHLGDRNEFLPTVHGFDEFYGNLYHLNAEEEPELPDYPKDPAFRAKYGPRGVLNCKASTTDDPTVDPRFGKVGKQVCEDTGPLTKARMLTIDDDIADRAVDFIKRQNTAGKPVFVWVNFTHMHLRTHTKPASIGQSGRWQSPYHDTMIDHDKNVGTVLKALDDLGIANNTFVMYSTDNGPHMNTWPDGAMTPFRNEKNSNWEGAYRVPAMFRWPGKVKPGEVSNEIVSHLDMLPTLAAVGGDTQVKDKLLEGYKVGDVTYKVYLDGDNLVPYHLEGDIAAVAYHPCTDLDQLLLHHLTRRSCAALRRFAADNPAPRCGLKFLNLMVWNGGDVGREKIKLVLSRRCWHLARGCPRLHAITGFRRAWCLPGVGNCERIRSRRRWCRVLPPSGSLMHQLKLPIRPRAGNRGLDREAEAG
jgi:arylsulfatase A-like enzyme